MGQVIFLNGASSAGKSSLAKALQLSLPEAYLHMSVDGFLHQLPEDYLQDPVYLGQALPGLLRGFALASAAVARAGNPVIVDHVLQEPAWVLPCVRAFVGLKVYFIGVHCALELLEAREQQRGDRQQGLARYQAERVHGHGVYDLEVDCGRLTALQAASQVADLLARQPEPQAFQLLLNRKSLGV